MEILRQLLNIGLLTLFILSGLNVLRVLFLFGRNLASPLPDKFSLSKLEVFIFGLSISLVAALLINGLKI